MSRWTVMLLLWGLMYPVFSSAQGCRLQFPTLNSTVIAAEEFASVILPFTASAECGQPFALVVFIDLPILSVMPKVCTFLMDGNCTLPMTFAAWASCSCLPGRFPFQMEMYVTRIDNGARLRFYLYNKYTDGFQRLKPSLIFSVTYPADIISLTLDTKHQQFHRDELEENSPLRVICAWDTGNPPVRARLLDRHGVEMEGGVHSSGQIEYTFPAVSCQDAGLIRCEAPGADHNKTATLKVRSPPQISMTEDRQQIIIEPGQNLQHEFDICTHTLDLETCHMTQSTSISGDHTGGLNVRNLSVGTLESTNSSVCNLTGTAPDLTLTVRLDNVRKEEEGQWRLELTNDAGTGHADVLLLLKRAPQFQTDTNLTELNLAAGQNTKVDFPVRSHTTHITDCRFVRMTSRASDGNDTKPAEESFMTTAVELSVNCTDSVSLNGTPPDLTLTVRLDNVRKEEEGQWRLELTNDAGTGYVDFLLVIKRSPQMSVVAGQDIQVDFPFRSRTTNITGCRLVRMTSKISGSDDTKRAEGSFLTRAAGFGVNCIGFIELTGFPPDLTLTVRLDKVRKEEDGHWQLKLTNDAGVSHMNFSLHVEDHADTRTDIVVYVAGGGGGGGVTVIVAVVTVVLFVRYRRRLAIRARYAQFEHSREREVAFYRTLGEALLPDSDADGDEADDLYHVVDDSHLGTDTSSQSAGSLPWERRPCRAPPTPRLHHVPLPPLPCEVPQAVTSLRRRWSLPEDYIHPTASSSDRRAVDNSDASLSHRRRSLPSDYTHLVFDYLTPVATVPNRRPDVPFDYLHPVHKLP